MTKLGQRLLKAADEALGIARGKADPKTYRIRIPSHVDVQAMRKRTGLSQTAFAARFAIPVSTLRDWEQHRRMPEGSYPADHDRQKSESSRGSLG